MSNPPDPSPVSSTSNIPTDQKALIIKVLEKVCPLETDIVGYDTVENILDGAEFTQVSGGSHINFMDSIAILSCVAGIAQVILTIWNPWNVKASSDIKNGDPEDVEKQTRTAVHEYITRNPEISATLTRHPQLVEQVFQTLKDLRGNQSASK